MKKLHNKIFYLIFGLLTFMLITILSITMFQNYAGEKKNIQNILMRANEEHPMKIDGEIPKLPDGETPPKMDDNKQKVFIDALVYTVTLDDNLKPTNIENNNTSSNTISEEDITKLLEKHNTNKNEVIDNLFFSNYAYKLSNNNKTMTIIDISSNKEKLIKVATTSFIILLIGEILIIILAKKITAWITIPVEETFQKQKEFIADASHELKTPLAVITSNIDMIEGKKEDEKWINNIKNESDRMNKLIINLLDLAKLENENNIELSNINLSKTFEKTILPFEGIMFEKKIKLSYNIQDNIEYLCNEEQIKEVIAILIDNAIKHSKGKIIANLKKEKKTISLEITNNGDPIPKGDEEKIFERFYKVDKSRNRKDNNYGLGLAIAKSIVEKNNGNIVAESKDGYTTFQILFKIK